MWSVGVGWINGEEILPESSGHLAVTKPMVRAQLQGTAFLVAPVDGDQAIRSTPRAGPQSFMADLGVLPVAVVLWENCVQVLYLLKDTHVLHRAQWPHPEAHVPAHRYTEIVYDAELDAFRGYLPYACHAMSPSEI